MMKYRFIITKESENRLISSIIEDSNQTITAYPNNAAAYSDELEDAVPTFETMGLDITPIAEYVIENNIDVSHIESLQSVVDSINNEG